MATGRQVIPYTIAEVDVNRVEQIAEQAFNSRSAVIAKAIHRVANDPQALGNTVAHLLRDPAAASERATTSLAVPADQLAELNVICDRLGLSKTAVLSLIVKGMVLGYI